MIWKLVKSTKKRFFGFFFIKFKKIIMKNISSNFLNKNIYFFICLLISIYFLLLPIIGFKFEYFCGDMGDGRLCLYSLEHAYQFITCKIHSFWNAPFMYPDRNVISYSENFIGTSPIYSIFRILGCNSYNSYILWFLIISILNYLTCYLFLYKVIKNHISASLGSVIFAFSLAIQSQLTHPQVFTRFPIPLVFLMLVYFLNTQKPIYFFLAYLFWVYQMYCSIYLGCLLLFPTLIFSIAIMIYQKDVFKSLFKQRKWFISIISGNILNILLLIPLLLPYMQRAGGASINHYFHQIVNTVPTTKSFFFSQEGSLLWDFLSFHSKDYPAWWDHQIFPGIVAILCLFLSICIFVRKLYKKNEILFIDRRLFIPFLFTICITFILFIRYYNFSAYVFIYFFPGFNSLRSLTRIINIELLFFAFSVSFISALLLEKYKKYKILIFLVLLVILILDNFYYTNHSFRTNKEIAINRQLRLEYLLKDIPKGSLISYEPTTLKDPVYIYHVDMMLVSQSLGLKTVNGYSGGFTYDYREYSANPNSKTRTEWFTVSNCHPDTMYILSNDSTKPIMLTKNDIFLPYDGIF